MLMSATSLFCFPATICVLKLYHPSLNHSYSNNRCEPFKDGYIIIQKDKLDVNVSNHPDYSLQGDWSFPHSLNEEITYPEKRIEALFH